MKGILPLLFFISALAGAQNLPDVLKEGEEVFAKTCATGYCHGSQGVGGGGAPRLAGRGFDQAFITNTVTRGIPNTAMQSYGNALSRADLVADPAAGAGRAHRRADDHVPTGQRRP